MPLAAAVAGVASAAIGAKASSKAAKKAAKMAQTTATENNTLQREIFQQNSATLAPFVQSGTRATTAIESLLGLSGDPTAQRAAFDAWRGSTGYDFQVKEGERAALAAFGKSGLRDSGAALRSANTRGQERAAGSFNTYFGALQGQQGVGLGAASAQAGVSTNYANAVSANNNAATETASNAALARAGILNNFLSTGVQAAALAGGLKSSYGQSSNASFVPVNYPVGTPRYGGFNSYA